MLRLMTLHVHVNRESMAKIPALKYISDILGVRVTMENVRDIYIIVRVGSGKCTNLSNVIKVFITLI